MLSRRAFVAGGISFFATVPAIAQHADHGPLLERLNEPGWIGIPDLALQQRVFGQNEAYDLKADRWFSYAPMPTPRHGMGAVTLGDSIYVAGGGPQMGGGVKSAVHEAFTLG